MTLVTSPRTRVSGNETHQRDPMKVTLLELVTSVGATAGDDREVVKTVLCLLERGRVRLRGCFSDAPISDFED